LRVFAYLYKDKKSTNYKMKIILWNNEKYDFTIQIYITYKLFYLSNEIKINLHA